MLNALAIRIAVYLAVAATCAILLFPLYWMVLTSLRPDHSLLVFPPEFLPSAPTLAAYERLLARTAMLRWLANSTLLTLTTIAVAVPIATLAGYALSRFRYRGVRETGYLLLVARMLPGSLLIIPLYAIFAQLGMLNNMLSLVVANTTFVVPFGTWMMKGFFDSIPRELEDSAQVDGCSILGAFTRVVLPLSLPGLAATVIYCAILTWSEFLFANTLMSGVERWTVTVGIASFVGEYLVQWNDILAAGLIFVIPVVVLFAFLERFLVQGLTAGAIKQ
jgi:multiple sugar transport system permease protein